MPAPAHFVSPLAIPSAQQAQLLTLGTATATVSAAPGHDSTISLGALIGSAGTTLSGSTAAIGTGGRVVTYSIGANNTSTIFDGVIKYGGDTTNITKVGTRSLTLTKTETYTGPTVVSAGTLLMNGSITASTTTVDSGATLGGTGTLTAAATNNGTINPGATGPAAWEPSPSAPGLPSVTTPPMPSIADFRGP